MKRRLLALALLALLSSGCFETEFKFKTIVHPNGSIVRETKIDGRGARLFMPPSGKGWEVKTYETRGGESILEDTYHHIDATGHFRHAEIMGSDYQYNTAEQFKNISDEERKNFITLGIVEPFEENVYSKNVVRVSKHRGIFKSTLEYQETFQNKAIIELLLNDMKKEVTRSQVALPGKTAATKNAEAKPAADTEAADKTSQEKETASEGVPPVTVEGQLLSSQVVQSVAEEKMKNEILSKFVFSSEVVMPGKIISSNAGLMNGKMAVWKFTMADFAPNFSNYTLEVKSEIIEWKTSALLLALILAVLFGISYTKNKKPASKAKPRRRPAQK